MFAPDDRVRLREPLWACLIDATFRVLKVTESPKCIYEVQDEKTQKVWKFPEVYLEGVA